VLIAPVMAAFDMLSTDGVAPEEER
jgi:hypothetical protein